jgi:NitT/TauT family transport system ATP-binding protein
VPDGNAAPLPRRGAAMASVSGLPAVGEVTVEGVTKRYGDEFATKTVVSDCSFTARKGRFTVLIGPSGCGKTTLINLIAGYEQPSAGRITLDSAPVRGPDSERLVVFQETALFPWMTVFENVLYGPSVRRVPRAKAEADTIALLAKVGLGDFRDKYPNQLSGGMQRRAELARALINRPRVLLMDEPFRGLDAMTRQLMQQYLLDLFEGSGQTILFVTSEIDEAILLADTLVLLSRAPASTKSVLAIDLPRPRDASLFKGLRYAELKKRVLSTLHEEAVKAFASGSRASADLVEAVRARPSA